MITQRLMLSAALMAAVCLVTTASAQVSRWQLGNPSLILDLPGSPASGGVAWHEAPQFSAFPTSWAGENADGRMEVSETYSAEGLDTVAANVAKRVSAAPTNLQRYKISGFDALAFSAGQRFGTVIQADGRTWIVLATPKTAAGDGMLRACLGSIVVERGGNPRWVRRSLGNTKLHADLPYDLSPDSRIGRPAERKSYELHWDDMNIDAFVQSPGQNSRFDYEATVKGFIEGEKSVQRTEEFKSKRERVKIDKLQGDIVTLDFKRGTKNYRLQALFALDQGSFLRMTLQLNPDNASHVANADRILSSLRVSTANFNGFEPRRIGTEALYLDLPKAIDAPTSVSGSKTYSLSMGGWGIDVRVTPIDPSTGSNPDQLVDFMKIKYERPDSSDHKFETGKRLIDGLEARTIRASYKKKGQSSRYLEAALCIFAADTIYVVEMITLEDSAEYVDRILDSARLDIPPPFGWQRWQVGESGVVSLWPSKPDVQIDKGSSGNMDQILAITLIETGFVAAVTELKWPKDVPSEGMYVRTLLKQACEAMGMEWEITEQRPFVIGRDEGLYASLKLSQNGKTLPGDFIIVNRGQYMWTMFTVYDASRAGIAVKRQALINSIR